MEYKFIHLGLFIALFLFLWFETNGPLLWLKLLRLDKFLPYYTEYKNIVDGGGKIGYLTFLSNIDKSFLIQLLSCSVCLSVWISLFISFISDSLRYFPVINITGLVVYFLIKILQSKANKV